MSTASSYEEAVEAHEWNVPDRYNIAVDVCDKHDADKLAMIHEDPDGNVREVKWGELQELSNRFANVLRDHGVEQGDRVAMLLPPTPETAAAFFGTYVEVQPHSRLAWTNEEGGGPGPVTTVTFEERGGGTLLTMRDLYPSKEALDEAMETGATSGYVETFDQLAELLAG